MAISVGERLKTVRIQKGIKQIEAAKALRISHGLLSHYENGIRQPSLDFLCTASQYYGVTTDYLLGLTDINAALPAGTPETSAAAAGFSQTTDIITGIYALLAIIDDPDLSARATDYIGANLYRIFRPLFDIHDVQYDADFSVSSDTFSLCGASATLSEAALLIRLRALPVEKIKMLHSLALKEKIPMNFSSFVDHLEKVDSQIFKCNPDPRYLDTYMP